MLRHLAEFPESRENLRLVRRFGSHKRLAVALHSRCNSRLLLNKNILIYPVLVRLLLVSGCSYKVVNRHHQTLLHQAAWYGCTKTSKLLIFMGANIEMVDNWNSARPLTKAIEKGKYESCKILISFGADVNVQYNYGWTTMLQVVRVFNDKKLEMLLIDAGAV